MNCFCFLCFLLKFSLFTWRKIRGEEKKTRQSGGENKLLFRYAFKQIIRQLLLSHCESVLWTVLKVKCEERKRGLKFEREKGMIFSFTFTYFYSHELSQWIFVCIFLCMEMEIKFMDRFTSLRQTRVSENGRIPMEWRNKNNYTSDDEWAGNQIHPASFLRLILSRQRIL